jgi:hypothetical protein
MRHVSLTCLNHPDLRWSCKEIAAGVDGRYNGARNIFFNGTKDCDWSVPVRECDCPPSDLRFSPEELELQKTHPLEA